MQTLGLLAESGHLGLATDLYQLSMAAAYLHAGTGQECATFEMFVRRLPSRRGYLVAAGLEQALEYLTRLRFDGDAIGYLRALPMFAHVPESFFEYLAGFRFTGDVAAVPEGTVVFPNEPLLQVRAPLVEAQLVETFLLAALNHQTMVATKAARVVQAARGRAVIEFGARRAHGFDAAIYGARAAMIGGCIGTSNVLAGLRFGVPIYGTAAHSFIMAFADESEAFAAFQRTFPEHATLLIDTYDTEEGARRVVALGKPVAGVRLDSGDLLALSKSVRKILDDGGLTNTRIVASGDLNEDSVTELLEAGAPIDSFGVGTELITSRDAPSLSGVYKLVAVDTDGIHRPVRKLSEGKATLPDVKQVYRHTGEDGRFRGDTIALATETLPGEPLLVPVLRGGELIAPLPPLAEVRERAAAQLAALPAAVRDHNTPVEYPVRQSAGLTAQIESLNARR